MPQIIAYLAEGRSPEQKRAFMQGVTEAAQSSLGVAADSVIVQIVEAPRSDKAKGGIPFSER